MDRDKMIDDLNSKLKEWDARLDAQEKKLASAKAEKRADFERKRAQLNADREKLELRIRSAKTEAGEGWERMSSELGDAWGEFKKAAEGVVDSLRS